MRGSSSSCETFSHRPAFVKTSAGRPTQTRTKKRNNKKQTRKHERTKTRKEKFFFIAHSNFDEFVKSPTRSLRGAKRRGNLTDIRLVTRLLRFARNDQAGVLGLFTNASIFVFSWFIFLVFVSAFSAVSAVGCPGLSSDDLALDAFCSEFAVLPLCPVFAVKGPDENTKFFMTVFCHVG